MPTAYSTILDKLQKVSVKNVSLANYTILDDDHYTEIWVTTGSSDRTIYLPTLADSISRKIRVVKIDSGSGKVLVTGEGSETINSTSVVPITEQYGWWEFIGGLTEWNGKTDGNSTIIEVKSTSDITLSTTDNIYQDPSGMNITITPGKWLIDYGAYHYVYQSGGIYQTQPYLGLGTVSGNNVYNIDAIGGYINVTGAYLYHFHIHHLKNNVPYSVSSNTTIYMKAYNYCAYTLTIHKLSGSSTTPIFIKARRTA